MEKGRRLGVLALIVGGTIIPAIVLVMSYMAAVQGLRLSTQTWMSQVILGILGLVILALGVYGFLRKQAIDHSQG